MRYTAPPCFAEIFEVRIDMISVPIFHTAKSAFKILAAAAVMAGWAADAFAQAYPARPVTVVVPAPAGGPTDIVGRLVAQML
ncbi:MAG TPA: hypothetical protein VNM70_14275, partial [Burkholderiales bacterium]|nr:hypothetical protein [Burkholderiales bacterium]